MDSDKEEFSVKNFNVFNMGGGMDALWNMSDYARNEVDFNIEDLFGCEIYLGFDFAPRIDISAIGALVKKDGIFYTWSDMFVAGSKDALFRKGTKINLAEHKGDININWRKPVPNKHAIVDRFKWYTENFMVMELGFDPAFSGNIVDDVEGFGIDAIVVKQWHAAYNEVVMSMENAMALDDVRFKKNLIQKYCFNNCVSDENKQGMRMAGKRDSKIHGDAIDPAIAIMTAWNRWIANNVENSAIAEFYRNYNKNE